MVGGTHGTGAASAGGMQRVLITGASSGIGRACAHQLGERGASLVLASRSAPMLETVRRECLDRGARSVAVVPTDVADAAAVEALFSATVAELGGVDGVIHTPAVLAYGRFTEVPAEVFDRVVRVNLLGSANVARTAVRHFEGVGAGSLVVVGSLLGTTITPFMSTYSATKAGQRALMRSLQVELRATPAVSVSLVSPGPVNTPAYDLAASYGGRTGRPPPPVSTPERVARRVVAALESPVREARVGVGGGLTVLGFGALPWLYDMLVGPLMGVFGVGRERRPEGPGNVFEPDPGREAVHGRWSGPLGVATSPYARPTRRDESMSTNRRTVHASPEDVWAVLSDGWLYPLWVVGAARMREVDDSWPAVGSRLHHSVGVWPLLINDNTEVRALEPGRMLELRGRAWPAGEAKIVITLERQGGGTVIQIQEDAVKGPGSLLPKVARTPLLHWRNTETLRRLADVVENRQRGGV